MSEEQIGQERWTAVDRYISEKVVTPDAALEAALAANAAAGLPSIDVAPNQGKLLHLFVKMMGAKRVLEIGTLGGYSTIWMARALPEGGRLVSLELNPKHAEVARANVARAAVADKVEIRVGAALDSLVALVTEGAAAFDLIFIDADKQNIPAYVGLAIHLARPGSLIITDNVIRDGAVIDPNSPDTAVQGVRRMFDLLAAEPRLTATAIQTVGSKGYDGFAMAIVNKV
jgi:predicted O-methyltransferase YrrM